MGDMHEPIPPLKRLRRVSAKQLIDVKLEEIEEDMPTMKPFHTDCNILFAVLTVLSSRGLCSDVALAKLLPCAQAAYEAAAPNLANRLNSRGLLLHDPRRYPYRRSRLVRPKIELAYDRPCRC